MTRRQICQTIQLTISVCVCRSSGKPTRFGSSSCPKVLVFGCSKLRPSAMTAPQKIFFYSALTYLNSNPEESNVAGNMLTQVSRLGQVGSCFGSVFDRIGSALAAAPGPFEPLISHVVSSKFYPNGLSTKLQPLTRLPRQVTYWRSGFQSGFLMG